MQHRPLTAILPPTGAMRGVSRAARCAAIGKFLHKVIHLPAACRRRIGASSTTLSVKVEWYEFRTAKHLCNAWIRAGTAPVGTSPRSPAGEALQPADGAGVRRLDPPLHPCERQAPSARHGWWGSGSLPDRARHAARSGGGYAEPGIGGVAVPVPRGAGAGLAMDGWGGASEKTATPPGRVEPRRGAPAAGAVAGPRLADGGPAVRHRHAPDGVSAPAGQGRGFPAPRHHH